MSTLSAIEHELVLIGILIKGIVKIFCGILQSGSSPRLGDLSRRPHGDKTRDKIHHEGVNIVGIARKEFSCKGSHVDWEEVVGLRIKDGLGVYIFVFMYAGKGQKVGEVCICGARFGELSARQIPRPHYPDQGHGQTSHRRNIHETIVSTQCKTCQIFVFPTPDLQLSIDFKQSPISELISSCVFRSRCSRRRQTQSHSS